MKGYSNNFLLEQEKLKDLEKNLSTNTKRRGSFYGKKGNKLESLLVELLSDPSELVKIKKDKSDTTYKLIIEKIISINDICLNDVYKIEATNAVPLLKSGGKAKTDLVISIHSLSEITYHAVSSKSSSVKNVSCHDYTAKAFDRVLDIKGTRLSKYISLFQKHKSQKGLLENLPKGYTIEEFAELLEEKKLVLIEWALSGKHDEENLVDREIQISKYIYLNVNGESAFYTMREYIDLLRGMAKGKLKTPFAWTYPSKEGGRRIQLKLPLILHS